MWGGERVGPMRKSPVVPETYVSSQDGVSCDPCSNLLRYRMGEGTIIDFIDEETESQSRYVTCLRQAGLGLDNRPIPQLC